MKQPAGFAAEDITVEVKGNALTVSAKKTEKAETTGEFLHQGIASRAFERRFQLADQVRPDIGRFGEYATAHPHE